MNETEFIIFISTSVGIVGGLWGIAYFIERQKDKKLNEHLRNYYKYLEDRYGWEK